MIKWLIEKAKYGFRDQNIGRLVENYLSLSVLQVINYLLPLITLPYLVRILGVEKFGLVMFAMAFIQYFLIFADYGFNLSATKEISVYRNNKTKVSEIFFSVMIIKSLLIFIGLLIFSAIVLGFDKFSGDWKVYFFTLGIVIGNTMFPIWFFQGMEKMKYITILNITAKSIFTILIFVFIREQSDYLYVPIFNSLGYISAGAISLWIIFRNFGLKVYIPKVSIVYGYFKNSTQFFLSRASVSLYSNSNTFIIGLFLGNAMAGYYAAAEKLFMAIRMVYTPLNTALYPYMCKAKNLKLYKRIFKYAVLFNFLLSLVIFIFSTFIINMLYGEGFMISADLLKIFSGLSLVMVPAILLGYPLLAAMGYPKYVNYSTIVASLLHIAILIAILPIINVYLVAAVTILTQLIVVGIRVYGVKKYLSGVRETSFCAE